jgi:hypothetical protein
VVTAVDAEAVSASLLDSELPMASQSVSKAWPAVAPMRSRRVESVVMGPE